MMVKRTALSKLLGDFWGKPINPVAKKPTTTRKLGHEMLEERQLLAAWTGGWESVTNNTYAPEPGSSFYANIPVTASAVALGRATSATLNDLFVVDLSANTYSCYKNNSMNFGTALVSNSPLDGNIKGKTSAAVFGDFYHDGYMDLLVVYHDSSTMTQNLSYVLYRGSATGAMGSVRTGSISVPGLGAGASFIAGSIQLAFTANTTNPNTLLNDIIIKVDGVTITNTVPATINNLVFRASWNSGTPAFATPTTADILPNTISQNANTGAIGAVSSTVLQTKTNTITGYTNSSTGPGFTVAYKKPSGSGQYPALIITQKTNAASNPWVAYTLTFGNIGIDYNVEPYWIQSLGDNVFVMGGKNLTNNSYQLLVVKITGVAADNSTVNAEISQQTTDEGFVLSRSGLVTAGKIGTAPIDLVIAEKGEAICYSGTTSATYGYTLTRISKPVITSTAYVGMTMGTYKVNGVPTVGYIAVGERNAWFFPGTTLTSAAKPIMISITGLDGGNIRKVVFSDFNNDGLTDFIALTGTTGGSAALFTQQTVENNGVYGKTSTVSGLTGEAVDIVVGKFSSGSGQRDDLAILTRTQLTGEYHNNLYVYELEGSGLSFKQVAKLETLPVTTGFTTLQTGKLTGGAYDDFVIAGVNYITAGGGSANAFVYVVSNSGAGALDSRLTNQNSYKIQLPPATARVNDRCYVDIGDINKDGKQDIAFLYVPQTGNSTVGYYLQKSAGGFDNNPHNTYSLTAGTNNSYTGLILDYVDEDQYLDLLTVRTTTGGTPTTTPLVFIGTAGSSNYFNQSALVKDTSSVTGGFSHNSFYFGKIGTKASNSFAIANGNTVTWWINSALSSGSVGQAAILVQGITQTNPGADINVAYTTARTWIDEYSWFYVDVWAKTGVADITSFSITVKYNPAFFRVITANCVPGTGFTQGDIVNDSVTGTITITGTGGAGRGKDTSALLERLYFAPVTGVCPALPQTGALAGVFTSYQTLGYSTITVAATDILLNSLPISGFEATSTKAGEQVTTVDKLPYYPVTFDITRTGSITLSDYSLFFTKGFGRTVTQIRTQNPTQLAYALMDFSNSGSVTLSDYSYFFATFGRGRSTTLNSIYGLPGISINPRLRDSFLPIASLLPEEAEIVAESAVFDAVLTQPIEETDSGIADEPVLGAELPLFFEPIAPLDYLPQEPLNSVVATPAPPTGSAVAMHYSYFAFDANRRTRGRTKDRLGFYSNIESNSRLDTGCQLLTDSAFESYFDDPLS